MTPRESEAPLSNEEYARMRSKFHDDEGNYNLLRGDVQSVRGRSGVWDTDYTLEKYVQSTDRLIGIMDGSTHERQITDPGDAERSRQKPDTVIFLDKSARPVSWFSDALWDQFAADGVEKPDYEFLNIDRTNWFVKQGHDPVNASRRLGPSDFDINKVGQEDIDRIRALFVVGELDRDSWRDQIWSMPTTLDDKNVLILDEVKNQGGTLVIATQVLKRAFPEAVISGDYFWKSGKYAVGRGEQQMESAPVWYDPKSPWGRGIGEVSLAYYEHQDDLKHTDETFKRMIGASALSAPHFNPDTFEPLVDKKALKLQQDIAYLSYGTGDGKILRSPDAERAMEDMAKYDSIIEGQGLTRQDFRRYARRRSSDNDSRSPGSHAA